MEERLQKVFKVAITSLLVFQLAGCGTLLYPERRGQVGGHLDSGVVILDAIGLLFFLIPGVIAFAVDFSNGTIYLPSHHPVVVTRVGLREIKFDPKHTSLAQLEKIIKDQTGCSVKLAEEDVRVSRLKSNQDMMEHFAQAVPDIQESRVALVVKEEECRMTNEAIVLLVLIVLVLGVLPAWPYSSSWGYGPTSGLALILVLLLIWVIAGGRPLFRNTAQDLRVTAEDTGHDLQSAGRNAADSIRNAVQ